MIDFCSIIYDLKKWHMEKKLLHYRQTHVEKFSAIFYHIRFGGYCYHFTFWF